MALRKNTEGVLPRGRPRGRPFEKGNNKKSESEILDSARREECAKSNIIEEYPAEEKKIADTPLINQNSIEEKELQTIDKIEFRNGDNVLSIRFSKKHNRMFRIQIFLNEQTEVRPVTYSGTSTGYAFWNLLKAALKK